MINNSATVYITVITTVILLYTVITVKILTSIIWLQLWEHYLFKQGENQEKKDSENPRILYDMPTKAKPISSKKLP